MTESNQADAVRKRHEAVAYELLRPEQIKTIRECCPIAYVPFGAIEWHGFHNPTGTDSLKAHAICAEAALKFGGVVLPAQYQGLLGDNNWGPKGWEGYTLGFNQAQMLRMQATGIVRALAAAAWRVIVLVTGHDVATQRDALLEALDEGTRGTDATGFAVMEGELHDNPDPSGPMPQITASLWEQWQARIEEVDPDLPLMMDHAAAWETSVMMYLYPDKVDLDAFRAREASSQDVFGGDWPGPLGMLGKNPLKYGSAEIGKKIVLKMAALIGRKAVSLLEEKRAGGADDRGGEDVQDT